MVERKNRHLLDVARSLLFQAHAPLFYWGEAILTVAYLINRLPTCVLNEQSPLEVLSHSSISFLFLFVPLVVYVFT